MSTNKVVCKSLFNKKMQKKFNTRYLLTHSFFMYLVFALGVYSLVILLTSEPDPEQNKALLYISWSIAIIGILFVPFFLLFNVNSITKKQQKEHMGIIETFEITKDKISKSETNGEKKLVLNWNTIAKVIEYKDVFYFYTTNDAAFLIPKQDIVEGNEEILGALVRKCITPKKNGKIPFSKRFK